MPPPTAGTAQGAGQPDMVTFAVAGERLAIGVADVAEVVRLSPVTRMPLGPASLVGLMNLRGTVLPVISLAVLLGGQGSADGPAARILVMGKGPRVGVLVDEVSALGAASDARAIDVAGLVERDFVRLAPRPRGPAAAAAATGQFGAVPAADRTVVGVLGLVLAGQEYGLPLDKVVGVTALPADVAVVPQTDEAMLGVIAVPGGLLPLVSLRVLLGLPPDGFDRARARIVVTRVGPAQVGLVVDAATATMTLDEAAIDPVPVVLTRGVGEASVEAIARLDGGRRLLAILAPARLFASDTASRILIAAQEGATAMSPADRAGSDAFGQYVIVELGGEQYGVPIAAVDEVVRRPDTLTRVPRAPAFVQGVMNLRGRIVPVIDQRQRFASPGAPDASARRSRVVVMTIDGLQAGFAVDSVSEVMAIPLRSLADAPPLATVDAAVFDRVAILDDGRVILLIEPRALLDQAERQLLAGLAAAG